jgi:hypothetical protein
MIRDRKQEAFVREFGCKLFDYRERKPNYAEVFNQVMSSYSSAQTTWVLEAIDSYDFLIYTIYVILVVALEITWQFTCEISTYQRNYTRVGICS